MLRLSAGKTKTALMRTKNVLVREACRQNHGDAIDYLMPLMDKPLDLSLLTEFSRDGRVHILDRLAPFFSSKEFARVLRTMLNDLAPNRESFEFFYARVDEKDLDDIFGNVSCHVDANKVVTPGAALFIERRKIDLERRALLHETSHFTSNINSKKSKM